MYQHFRPSEQPLVKRFEEFAHRVERSSISVLTDFLSPREAWIAKIVASKHSLGSFDYGGYDGAERTRTFFCSYGQEVSKHEYEIVAMQIDVSRGGEKLRHADFLGALLGLGIRREAIGDIAFLPEGKTAFAFCIKQMAPILLRDLTQVGRFPVHVRLEEKPPVAQFVQAVMSERQVTLQSLRLDAFLAHAFGLSRSKAVEPIRSGKVRLNYAVCLEPAQEIQVNDLVSLRGFGRARVLAIEGNSRSGRTFVRIGRYE